MAILPSVLAQYAERVEKAGFGEKEKIIEEGCAFTGLSRATFLRQIKPYRPASGRKVRSDKGKHQMDANELKLISAAWLHLRRKNGKTMATLERILDILRANDKVKAEFVDEKTGEVRPYSASSVERALRNANLHPDQLLRPAPVVQLQSRHPNHVWQIDPSVCAVLPERDWQRQWVVRNGGGTILQKQASECGESRTATSVAVCHYRPREWRDLCGICVWRRNGGEHF